MRKVSIIIPNFNGESLLKSNLPYVINAVNFSNKSGELKADIIIVDDCSTDRSVKLIEGFQKKCSFIQLFINDYNSGFAKSVNIGIEKTDSNIVILLNSDVIIPENFINEIITPFKKNNVFAVSPLIMDSKKGILSGSYKIPFLKQGEIKYRKWKKFKYQSKELLKTFFCEGGSVAINREKYFNIGGFDSIYEPFYFEDTDICVKAWKKGWISYFKTNISVIHDHKSTISRYYCKQFIKRTMRRNRFVFLWSNLPFKYLFFVHVPFIFKRIIVNSIKFDFSYVAGLIEALKFIKEVKKKRKKEGTEKFFEIIKEINNDFKKINYGQNV